ncbi:major facilitator superfamily domain-containing protein [Cantharellus anzutake]|uniref:major facilitator superfamily domain-containing protein n=1 Tax=Cantharellus anzutake TaxID=1750568 RepID=UPI00190751F2|nr:major facilitator superfamily domain-containing protein [Cantharellus anzutake]KAF8333075.1 major facilitator superfamily domain-containing protein [Cantharellus anzutake]
MPLLQTSESSPSPFDSWPQARLSTFERTLVKQIDIRLMPLLCLFYILNYLDRKQYDTCVSILFVGYSTFAALTSRPLQCRPFSHLLPRILHLRLHGVWGFLSACTSITQNFTGLLLCRFLLGFAESAFFPGAMFYISSWYNKKELALRAAFLFSGSPIGSALGGPVAVGLLKLDGTCGMAGWRWLFLVEGLATIAIALLSIFILPDLPSSPHLLRDSHRRSTRDGSGNAKRINLLEAFWMVIVDEKTWMFGAILTCISVVQTLGYSRSITLLLTAPPYLLSCVVMMLNGFHSDKTQERFKHVSIPLVVLVLAHILALSTTAVVPRYLAMLALPSSYSSSIIVSLTWISETLNQPPEKRAAAIAFLNAVAHTANVWTPYLYTSPPRYLLAFSVNIAAALLAIISSAFTRQHLKILNDEEENEGRRGQYIL